MTQDQLLWGAVSILMKQHGEHAPRRVAERIGALAVAGDMAGVAMWKDIARRMDMMMRSPVQ
ncbi:hypothetical protein OVY48_03125 [Sphingobium sp. SA2]|jgi:hypothetical protein|uniref:DUF6961 family protein n=1 Tax=Sphingobium sp. SA2 TaxID=1524832 RepID=UPI0028C0C97B|nr:hypothetical protein [Sphingobium sp. SA2]